MKSKPVSNSNKKATAKPELWRLNKFIAHAGVCSRRKADELISSGKIKVNGKLIAEPGHKVSLNDEVVYEGKTLCAEKKLYILLNKPKDYIATTDDDRGRKTVIDLIKYKLHPQFATYRLYPVGRLDRKTTGLLLITNDGDLSEKLAHPRSQVTKTYKIGLESPLKKIDFHSIAQGIKLEDGFIKVDEIAFPDSADHRIIGIKIHSGKNRIIRRIFEHLGYNVKTLDRVIFANLTKKDLPRGKWRFLKEKEIIRLKYLNS